MRLDTMDKGRRDEEIRLGRIIHGQGVTISRTWRILSICIISSICIKDLISVTDRKDGRLIIDAGRLKVMCGKGKS